MVAPFILGWGASAYFNLNEGRLGHIFIGISCATSVGITARVFKDLKIGNARSSHYLAAVIDDVLGLLILGNRRIKAAGTGTSLLYSMSF